MTDLYRQMYNLGNRTALLHSTKNALLNELDNPTHNHTVRTALNTTLEQTEQFLEDIDHEYAELRALCNEEVYELNTLKEQQI